MRGKRKYFEEVKLRTLKLSLLLVNLFSSDKDNAFDMLFYIHMYG